MNREPSLPQELTMTPEEVKEYQAEVRRLRDELSPGDEREIYVVEDKDIVIAKDPDPAVIQKIKKAVYKNDDETLIALIQGLDTNARNWGVAYGKALASEDEKKSDDHIVHRSAESGQFVDEDEVKEHPGTTVTETVGD